MPFERIETPELACDLSWTPLQIAAFARSWSAHKKAREDGHADTLEKIERDALSALGTSTRQFRLPLHVVAARIA